MSKSNRRGFRDFRNMLSNSGYNRYQRGRYLYLIDPQADRFPYGSRELTGQNLDLLRELNRSGFILENAPSSVKHHGSKKEKIVNALSIVIASLGATALFTSTLITLAAHTPLSFVLFPVIIGAAAILIGGIPQLILRWLHRVSSPHWRGGADLFDAVKAKQVDAWNPAEKLAEAIRESFKSLTNSPQWDRMSANDGVKAILTIDRLLFSLAVASETTNSKDKIELIKKIEPQAAEFLKINAANVDPARSAEQMAKELLGAFPEPIEPQQIDIDYSPSRVYAPYPENRAK